MSAEQKYDVVAVHVNAGSVRVLEWDLTRDNAEAVIKMAVARRGVDEEFFAEVPHGTYHDGEEWVGRDRRPRAVRA